MKKISLIVILFFIVSLSNQTYAKTDINCSFSFHEYLGEWGNVSYLELTIFNKLYIDVELETESKSSWQVNNISFPNSFKENLNKLTSDGIIILKKILYKEPLKESEEILVSYISSFFNISMNDIKSLSNLSEKEKEQLLINYDNLIEEQTPILDEFLINQGNYLQEIIEALNSSQNVTSINENLLLITTVMNSGLIFKTEINNSKIINKNSDKGIITQLLFTDGSSIKLSGECINENINGKNRKNESSENDTVNKLRQLKKLFEDELITEEEYDAKRKEILDKI